MNKEVNALMAKKIKVADLSLDDIVNYMIKLGYFDFNKAQAITYINAFLIIVAAYVDAGYSVKLGDFGRILKTKDLVRFKRGLLFSTEYQDFPITENQKQRRRRGSF